MMATESGSELKKRIIISIDNDLEQIPDYLLDPSKWQDWVKAISDGARVPEVLQNSGQFTIMIYLRQDLAQAWIAIQRIRAPRGGLSSKKLR